MIIKIVNKIADWISKIGFPYYSGFSIVLINNQKEGTKNG